MVVVFLCLRPLTRLHKIASEEEKSSALSTLAFFNIALSTSQLNTVLYSHREHLSLPLQ
jgi:hypothetical protein